MKKAVIIIAFLAASTPGFSQQAGCEKVSVTDLKVEKAGNELKISFSVTPTKNAIKSNDKITLSPYLYGGGDTVALEPLEMAGRRWMCKERQAQRLARVKKEAAIKLFPAVGQSRYEVSLAYRKYMDCLSLRLVETTEGCCAIDVTGSEMLVTNLVLRSKPEEYTVSPVVSYITPVAGQESGAAFLGFEVGKHHLLPELGDNDRELAQMRRSVELVRNDNRIEIKKISLIGYASPEGRWDSNATLSQKRSQVVADYLRNSYKLPARLIAVSSVAEDWDGLAQLVAADPFLSTQKEVLLRIIGSNAAPDQKENRMMALQNGVPYAHMLATLYPRLRKTTFRIDYAVKTLSTDGSKESNEVFEAALLVCPDDTTANSNAAAAALACGDTGRAAECLLKAGNNPLTENNRGVLHLLRGEYKMAELAFNRALAGGVAEAAQNLEQLKQKAANARERAEYDSIE